jgi:hypothetical protein
MPGAATLEAPAAAPELTPDLNVAGKMLDGGIAPANGADGYTEKTAAEFDWSHLNNNESPAVDYNPDETIEQFAIRKQKEMDEAQAKIEAGTPDKDKTTTTETKTTEDKNDPANAKTDAEAIEKKAQTWDKFDQAFQKNPAVIAKYAFDAMTSDQKAAFIRAEGLASAPPTQQPAAEPKDLFPDIAEDFEGDTEMENALALRWKNIKNLPALEKQVADLQSSIDERVGSKIRELDNPIATAAVQSIIGLRKLDMLCEALGLNLPTPSLPAIGEILKDGRTTFDSAVDRLTTEAYKKAVAEYKQGKAPRPNTPGNSSTNNPELRAGASMYECAKHLGVI